MKKFFLKAILWGTATIILTFIIGLIINIYVIFFARPFVIFSTHEIPKLDNKPVALVLGAQVYGTTVSRVLQDRLEAAIDFYNTSSAQALLLSGDHGKKWYDEVNAMRTYVVQNYPQINKNRVFLDHAGFDTYDSMYRARDVFLIKSMVIFTQEFHSYRAAYIARKLGLNAYCFAISENSYPKNLQRFWQFREFFARIKAFFETLIKRNPHFLGEPIPITESSSKTWDSL